MTGIGVLVSGNGTNLQALIDGTVSGDIPNARIRLVLSDCPGAHALTRARDAGIEHRVCDEDDRADRERRMQEILRERDIGLLCLAGYMRLLSPGFVAAWQGRILNIHPSLLPDLPGLHTHRKALAQGRKEHGATVHFVDESLDGGPRILFARTAVRTEDTEDSLARRVLRLEHRLYAAVVAAFCARELELDGTTVRWSGTPWQALGNLMRARRIAFLLLALPGLVQATEMTRGHYDLYYRDFLAGELVITLTRTDGRIRYEAHGKPGALARLLGKDTITEQGVLDSSSLRPLWYLYRDEDKGRQYEYFYDWNERQVRIRSEGRDETLPLDDDMTDPVALTVRSILRGPELPEKLRLLSRGDLRTHTFAPPRKIPTENGEWWEVESLSVEKHEVRIVSHYDPQRDHWLVRLERWDDGRSKFRLELKRLERGSGPGDLHPLDQ